MISNFKAVLSEFEQEIVQYDDCQHVVGGKLLIFLEGNRNCSLQYCVEKSNCVYEPLHQMIEAILLCGSESIADTQTFQDILDRTKEVRVEYLKTARGPAKWKVDKELKQKIEQEQEKLKILHVYKKEAVEKAHEAANENAKRQKEEEEKIMLRNQKEEEKQFYQDQLQQQMKINKDLHDQHMKDLDERAAQEVERAKELHKAQMIELEEKTTRNEANLRSEKERLETKHENEIRTLTERLEENSKRSVTQNEFDSMVTRQAKVEEDLVRIQGRNCKYGNSYYS